MLRTLSYCDYLCFADERVVVYKKTFLREAIKNIIWTVTKTPGYSRYNGLLNFHTALSVTTFQRPHSYLVESERSRSSQYDIVSK